MEQSNDFLLSVLTPFLTLSRYSQKSLQGALKLNMILRKYNLNLVTLESLTAGLVAKSIVDIPSFGANLYGGLIVYDTSAKRSWLGVTTPSVYSRETAKQMAEGGLRQSRALVSLAVTGNSSPSPEHLEALGVVDMGLSIRRPKGKMVTFTKRIVLCEEDPELLSLCARFQKEAHSEDQNLKSVPIQLGQVLPQGYQYFTSPLYDQKKGQSVHFATIQTTAQVGQVLRLATVAIATSWAAEKIETFFQHTGLSEQEIQNEKLLPCTPEDFLYTTCNEPSYVIRKHLDLNHLSCQGFNMETISSPPGPCCGIPSKKDYNPQCPRVFSSLSHHAKPNLHNNRANPN
jgi:nicotinamide mononucleotide (NMN) deamidase PncC